MPWYAVKSAVTFSRKCILAEPDCFLSTIATEVSSLEAGINVHSGFGVAKLTMMIRSRASKGRDAVRTRSVEIHRRGSCGQQLKQGADAA